MTRKIRSYDFEFADCEYGDIGYGEVEGEFGEVSNPNADDCRLELV